MVFGEITEQSPAEGKLQNVFLKAWNPFFYAERIPAFSNRWERHNERERPAEKGDGVSESSGGRERQPVS